MASSVRSARLLLVLVTLVFAGCATPPRAQIVPNPVHATTVQGRKLIVFLDGTSNEWRARTNVRRFFELAAAQENPHRLCFWMEGVGTDSVVGKVFGEGMRGRIMAAYDFLARNYRAGDDTIYVFGFSRGAFEARALCGLLAHCGLYEMSTDAHDRFARAAEPIPVNDIWDVGSNLPEPARGGRDIGELLSENHAAVVSHFGRAFTPAPVRFLGLWDTVPGLQSTHFDDQGVQSGQRIDHPRYKVKPYPNIHTIAHALSIDEKRSQFHPLLVGPPLVPGKTTVHEVWFPGVHSDVGGGYADSNEMASQSLGWMLELLKDDRVIPGVYDLYRNVKGGIIHHSENDFWGALGSHPVGRQVPWGSEVHESVLERLQATGPVYESDGDSGAPPHVQPYRPALAADFWKDGVFDVKGFSQRFKIVGRGAATATQTTGAPLTIGEMHVQTAAPLTPVQKQEQAAVPTPAGARKHPASPPAPTGGARL